MNYHIIYSTAGFVTIQFWVFCVTQAIKQELPILLMKVISKLRMKTL